MAFLQSYVLLALPLIGLPILIHLLNQRRHKAIVWGAMLFVRQAQQMNKGVARLRYWFILLLRMLAVAGLIFAISRPLASGWMGLSVGGSKRTMIVLLNRSPSMEYQDTQSGISRRSTAIARLDDMFRTTGGGADRVLIESNTNTPIPLRPDTALSDLRETGPSSTSADLPDMMFAALEYLKTNDIGTADIWVCSDLQQSDWDAQSGRWQQLRDEFSELESVRLLLLSYPDQTETNLAISVDNVRRRTTTNASDLVMDVRVTQTGGDLHKRIVPLAFDIAGVRTTVEIEIGGRRSAQSGLTIPIDPAVASGVGRVELPGDANPADNIYQFAFADPPVMRTVVVSDDDYVAELLNLAASTPVNSMLSYSCETLSTSRVNEIDWQKTALIVWHGALPTGMTARQLREFVDSDRTVIFLPDDSSAVSAASETAFCGAGWGQWKDIVAESGMLVQGWRTDSDLLRNSDAGRALPVGELRVYRIRGISDVNVTPLATLQDDSPLLSRAFTERGAVYFCGTLPLETHSTLAKEGITLFVMLQRALQQGSQNVGPALSVVAGANVPRDIEDWKPASEADEEILLSERAFQSGAFKKDGRFIAVNRSVSEDSPEVISSETIDYLLSGLSYKIIDDKVGALGSLANEIWRIFIIGMIVALISEAILSLPARKEPDKRSYVATLPETA